MIQYYKHRYYKYYLTSAEYVNNTNKVFYKLEYNGFNIVIKERIICNYQNDIGSYFYTNKPLYFNKQQCITVSVLKWYRILRKTIIYRKINEKRIHVL